MKKNKIKDEELKKEECNCDCDCDCGCSSTDGCTCSDECSCGDNCTCSDNGSYECECDCSNQDNSLEDEINELKNKLLYKDAELINYRKRKDEETATLLKYASQDLILDIVKSVDNFERAIQSIKTDDEADNEKMLAGIEMIYNELKNTLEKYGVKEISEVDVAFDANIHHAVMTDEVLDKEDDVVLEVMIKGYIYKDRVIRPAMVKVNKIN